MDAVQKILGCPAAHVLKESDRTDAAVLAEVKPVAGSQRHADHVPRPDFDAKDRLTIRRAIAGVDVKHAPALQDKSYLVFGVCVLLIKAVEHGIQVWRVWVDINHIGCDESPPLFQFLNFG